MACVCIAVSLCTQSGRSSESGLVLGGLLFAVCGLTVFLLHRFWVRDRVKGQKQKLFLAVLEGLFVAVLLGAGIFLRMQGAPWTEFSSEYYEAAKVVQGGELPRIVHGAVHIYLQLLHLICILAGNKPAACIVLQLFLQLAAFLLFYAGIRKTAGRAGAISFFAFAMLSPEMIRQSLTLSPDMLFLLFFAAGLVCVAGLSGTGNVFLLFLAGVISAAVCYFDVTGVLLLIPAFGILFAAPEAGKEGTSQGKLRRKPALMLCAACTAGFLTGFLGAIAIDWLSCGRPFEKILQAWFLLFFPKSPALPFWMTESAVELEIIFLFVCLLFGVFSFWCQKKRDSFKIWFLMIFMLFAFQCFGMTAEEMEGRSLLFLLLTVPAGIGIREIFAGRRAQRAAEETSLSENLVLQEEEASEEPAAGREEEETGVAVKEADRKVSYIENPLPLPRKHTKKIMDYKLKASEKDEFDFDVEAEDDYDI